jgi:hypothetical protein
VKACLLSTHLDLRGISAFGCALTSCAEVNANRQATDSRHECLLYSASVQTGALAAHSCAEPSVHRPRRSGSGRRPSEQFRGLAGGVSGGNFKPSRLRGAPGRGGWLLPNHPAAASPPLCSLALLWRRAEAAVSVGSSPPCAVFISSARASCLAQQPAGLRAACPGHGSVSGTS